jgi:NAD(P)-dependent dehydrogenase (short-subunit alcohol dehydrogenase family)
MMPLLAGKIVFVSGGSQGLGAGIARAAVREGASVVVSGRRREPGEKLVGELAEQGAAARFVQADVSDVDPCSSCRTAVVSSPIRSSTGTRSSSAARTDRFVSSTSELS